MSRYAGKHYQQPPQKIDDRRRGVQTLTLIPKPLNTSVEIWQPVTSPPTAEYVARQRHIAVYWFQTAACSSGAGSAIDQMQRFAADIQPRLQDAPLPAVASA